MDDSFEITVNGEPRRCASGASVTEFLGSLGLDPRRVVVELDGNILPVESFTGHELKAGDSLEIIQFVGGG